MFPPTHSLHVLFVRHSLAALSTSPLLPRSLSLLHPSCSSLGPRSWFSTLGKKEEEGGGGGKKSSNSTLCLPLSISPPFLFFHFFFSLPLPGYPPTHPPARPLSCSCSPLDCASLSVCPFALAHFPSFPPTVSCPSLLSIPFSRSLSSAPSCPPLLLLLLLYPAFISHSSLCVPHMHRWTHTHALKVHSPPFENLIPGTIWYGAAL